MVNTNTFKMRIPKELTQSSVRRIVHFLIQKYHCLPSPVVHEYCNKILKKNTVSRETVASALRKLYANGEIERLSDGVYCRNDF